MVRVKGFKGLGVLGFKVQGFRKRVKGLEFRAKTISGAVVGCPQADEERKRGAQGYP